MSWAVLPEMSGKPSAQPPLGADWLCPRGSVATAQQALGRPSLPITVTFPGLGLDSLLCFPNATFCPHLCF